jgi:enoyl-CoA hydratase/carnithine racemase
MTNQRSLIEHPGERVAHVVMNRPEKLNAMDRRFFDELRDVKGRYTTIRSRIPLVRFLLLLFNPN